MRPRLKTPRRLQAQAEGASRPAPQQGAPMDAAAMLQQTPRSVAQRSRIDAAFGAAAPVQRVIGATDPFALKRTGPQAVVKHLEAGDEAGWSLVAVKGQQLQLQPPAGEVVVVYCEDPAYSLASQAAAGRDDFDAGRVALTAAETWSVRAYTSSLHNFINPILRKPADSEAERASLLTHIRENRPNAAVPDTVEGFLLLLQTALAKLPDSKATVLTKGINLDVHGESEPRYGRNSHPEGAEFAPPDYTSTSQGNPFTDRDSLIVYELPPGHGGKPVRTLSDHPTEREVLFGPGMRYTIVRVHEKGTDDFAAAAEAQGVPADSKVQRIVMVRVLPRADAGAQ